MSLVADVTHTVGVCFPVASLHQRELAQLCHLIDNGKEQNLAAVDGHTRFAFRETDLVIADLTTMFTGTDVVFHLAGQAGVRTSWGTEFEIYTKRNILATQRLLESAKGADLYRFVYASSSSVYGNTRGLPVTEKSLPLPISPYVVSKLAAEYLCRLY